MKRKRFLIYASLPFVLMGCNSNNSSEEEKTYITLTAKVFFSDETDVSNLKIQWCWEGSCSKLVNVDSNGCASLEILKKDMYYVHVLDYDKEVYTYDVSKSLATPANTYTQIEMLKIDSPVSGSGTEKDHYVIEEGNFNVHLDSDTDKQYFDFVSKETATYCIYSMSPNIDTYIEDLINKTFDDNSGLENNFYYEFNAEKDESYSFALSASIYEFYPVTYSFKISKKA